MSASSPDHLYLDLSVINNDNLGNQPKSVLNFTENRTNPILDNPSNYFLSIARFYVDTPAVTLPIFIPALNVDGINNPLGYTDLNGNTGQGGFNQTCYTITMAEVNGNGTMSNVQSLNVLWSPEDKTASLPKNPQVLDAFGNIIPNSVYTGQDITTGYYNCYNAVWWINCINYTLLNVWKNIGGASTFTAPFLTIEPNTNLVSLYTPTGSNNFAVQDIFANGIGATGGIWSGGSTNPAIKYALWFNEPLFNLFSGFPSVYYGNNFANPNYATTSISDTTSAIAIQRPYLFNYLIQPSTYPSSPTITTGTGATLAVFNITTSEYSPVPMWNPIQSLTFTSTLIPIVLSYDTQAIPYNTPSYNTITSGGNNALVTNMLSDIQVGLTTGSEYKPSVLYLPQNEYRLVDLNGNCPINQASFSVSWKTKYNQVIPFRLGAQCGANIKILFRRKRFNLANLPPYDTN